MVISFKENATAVDVGNRILGFAINGLRLTARKISRAFNVNAVATPAVNQVGDFRNASISMEDPNRIAQTCIKFYLRTDND